MDTPYRTGELTAPEQPTLRFPWKAIITGVVLATLLWLVSFSLVCAVPFLVPFPLAVGSLLLWRRRTVEWRQRAIGRVVIFSALAVVPVVLAVERARDDRLEARMVAEATRIYRATGGVPTTEELARALGSPPRTRHPVVQYQPLPGENDALVIHTVVPPFGRRVTRISTGDVAFID